MRKQVFSGAVILSGTLFLSNVSLAQAHLALVASLAWYMYPITQAYNGSNEMGEDLGTPQGTPITSLVNGQLAGAGFYGGGGVVTVRTTFNGTAIDLYVQHLDSIVNVSLCQYGNCGDQTVSAGELLGYSGGDCNWHNSPDFGQFNACADGFSNGPHIEVGINPPWYGIWGPDPHPGPNSDPSATMLALINQSVGQSTSSSNSVTQTVSPKTGPTSASSCNDGCTAPSSSTYVVQVGDTLLSIGSQYHLSWSQLYEANRSVIGSNPDLIYPGEKLKVKFCGDGDNDSDDTVCVPFITYVVQSGDTLSTIGVKYNLPWSQIYADNKSVIGSDPNLIYVGEKLQIKKG